ERYVSRPTFLMRAGQNRRWSLSSPISFESFGEEGWLRAFTILPTTRLRLSSNLSRQPSPDKRCQLNRSMQQRCSALQERRSGGQLLLLGGVDGMRLIRPRSEFQF